MTVILKNNASGFLAAAISNTDTTVLLTTGTGANFPSLGASQYFYATIVPTSGASEIVKCTARSGDTLTVVRAQEGTSALSFAGGSRVELRVTAQSVIDAIDDRVAQYNEASEIAFTPYANITSTNVQAAIQEEIDDLAAQGGAALIGNTPAGTIAATTVQGAINEIVSDLAASGGSALVGYTQGGTGAATRTVQAKNRDAVDVRDFTGVDPTGATDSTTGIANAIATGKSVDLGGYENTYLISSTLTLNAGQMLFGSGATLKTTSNIRVVTMANNCSVEGVRFLGNDTGSGQIGVYINAVSRTKVSNCTFVDLAGAGYWVENIVSNHQGNTLTGSTFTSCGWGINIAERGEYTTVTGCNVDLCSVGIRIIGGNTVVAGCVSSDCTIGILVGKGANDAHGMVVGCLVNHSTQYAVKCEEPNTNDFRFADCEFYYGDVWMYRSVGMHFADCTFGSNDNFYFQGSIDTYFDACRFVTLPTFNNSYSGEESKTHWVNTQYPGGLTSGVSAPNINGGYIEIKLGSNVTGVGAGVAIFPFDTLTYNALTNDLNYTYQAFTNLSAGSHQIQNLEDLKSPNSNFNFDIYAQINVGVASGAIDYSLIDVYMYDVSSQREYYFTPEPGFQGSNPGVSWRRYTFSGSLSKGTWRVAVNNRSGVNIVFYRDQGYAVPARLVATGF